MKESEGDRLKYAVYENTRIPLCIPKHPFSETNE